jgi:hypothetical protein
MQGAHLRLILSWCCLLIACGEEAMAPESVQVRSAATAPGMWSPPASTLAIGDRQSVRRDGSPLIAPGGSCASTNPWACSCSHPACSAGLPGTLELAQFLKRRFPQITSAGGFQCCRQNTGGTSYLSVHSIGRAIDLSIPQINGDADNTKGDAVGNWLIEHAQEIGIQIVIWDRASWNGSRAPGSKLSAYTGPIPHTDHLHIELNLDGANRRTSFFTSGASQGGASCTPRCEGSVVVQADCSTGDCGAFGVTCIADPAPRCVVPSCPPRGLGKICLNEREILSCKDGLPDGAAGDCSAFGSWCSTAGVEPTAARCVLSLCVGGPNEVPVPHQQCSVFAGKMLDCLDTGNGTQRACAPGEICSMLGGQPGCAVPRPECPVVPDGAPFDDRTVCLSTGQLVRCFNGNIYAETGCGPGAVCSSVGGAAHCAQAACLGAGGEVVQGDVCTGAGDVATCDAQGTFTEVRACPMGEACQGAAGSAACAPGQRPTDDGSGVDTPGLIEPPMAPAPGEDMGAALDEDMSVAPDAGVEPEAPGRPGSVSATGESCASAAGAPDASGRTLLLCLLALAALGRRRRHARGQGGEG